MRSSWVKPNDHKFNDLVKTHNHIFGRDNQGVGIMEPYRSRTASGEVNEAGDISVEKHSPPQAEYRFLYEWDEPSYSI